MNYYSDSIGTWSKCIIKCVFIDPRHVCRNLFLKMNILNFSKTLEKRDDKNTVNFNSPHPTWMQNLSVLWLFISLWITPLYKDYSTINFKTSWTVDGAVLVSDRHPLSVFTGPNSYTAIMSKWSASAPFFPTFWIF